MLTDFRAGFGITTARRLARVKMTAGGAQVRRYQLAVRARHRDVGRLEARVGHDVRHRRQDRPADDLVRLHRLRPGRPAGRGDRESAGVLARPTRTRSWPTSTATARPISSTRRWAGTRSRSTRAGASPAPFAIPSNPSVQLAANGTELADFDGDGIVDLLSKLSPGAGDFVFFPNRGRGDWEPATRFRNNPGVLVRGSRRPPDRFRRRRAGRRHADDADRSTTTGATTATARGARRSVARRSPTSPIVFSDAQVRLADMNGDRLHRPRLRARWRDRLLAQPRLGALGQHRRPSRAHPTRAPIRRACSSPT